MKRRCTFLHVVVLVVIAGMAALASGGASAQTNSTPSLKGVWVGKADIMLPEGMTHQLHRFEFVEQEGPYLNNPDVLEFTAWDGGAHPLVGRGTLVRE